MKSRARSAVSVFVSSTYEDLKEHRRAVDEILRRMRRLHVGMEYFGARAAEPMQASLDEIARCNSFIGIYAHRYGWVPEHAGSSITQLEFDYARQLQIPIYCFVVDPTFPWPPVYIEHDARDRLAAFLRKVNSFVRATFTTPDDLAKQVAATINNLVADDADPSQSSASLKSELADGIRREISASVGRKYIRELYVPRAAGKALLKRLRNPTEPNRILSVLTGELRPALPLSVATLAAVRKHDRGTSLSNSRLAELVAVIEDSAHGSVLRPSETVLEAPLKQLRSAAQIILRAAAATGTIDNEVRDQFARIVRQIDELWTNLKPLDVIVDRAGGGKTNLLCRLAEELGDDVPTIFFCARSITGTSRSDITESLAQRYPVSDDPIATAAQAAQLEGSVAVVLIDAINEHLDPIALNTGLQALVQHYRAQAVRFVVSCRDIYWTYFEDDWWREHARSIMKGRLYAFKPVEFDRALRLYLGAYDIEARLTKDAANQLRHALLLRFYCETFQGKPGRPTQRGLERDIRLLDLFDTYCHTKFASIQKRLTLNSADAVWELVEMIGRIMLQDGVRQVSLQRLAAEARDKFGEKEIRQLGSRYVGILDEDIIVEERPIGASFERNVNFVYDEFMEYTIALILWRDLRARGRVRAYDVARVARSMLARQREFTSVINIVSYLGGLLARGRPAEGLSFLDWLISNRRADIATSIIDRWPGDRGNRELFQRLVRIHADETGAEIRSRAWTVLEKLSQWNWSAFMAYVKRMDMSGAFRPGVVFTALARLGGGNSPSERLKTMRWLARLSRSRRVARAVHTQEIDELATSAGRICAIGAARWKPSELHEAQRHLDAIERFRQAALRGVEDIHDAATKEVEDLSRQAENRTKV